MDNLACAVFFFLILGATAAHGGGIQADIPLRGAAAKSKGFILGYNEAWFGTNFGTDYTTKFDLARVERTMAGVKKAGGSVIRLWLFEGRQGIILKASAPQTQSVSPQMLENIGKTMDAASHNGLKVYLTLFDGNEMKADATNYDYFFNLFNNKFGEQDAFIAKALKPLLTALESYRHAIFGMDLINEVDGILAGEIWAGDWNAARLWIRSMKSAIKAESPWLEVTASIGSELRFGFATGLTDSSAAIGSGKLSGLGLDFYDLHAYSNEGVIPDLANLCQRVKLEGKTVILGEFGQKSKTTDDELQVKSTGNFIANAKASCFSGAMAWRYDAAEHFWHFIRADGSSRPAVTVMQSAINR